MRVAATCVARKAVGERIEEGELVHQVHVETRSEFWQIRQAFEPLKPVCT
jgi:hypothetical protein